MYLWDRKLAALCYREIYLPRSLTISRRPCRFRAVDVLAAPLVTHTYRPNLAAHHRWNLCNVSLGLETVLPCALPQDNVILTIIDIMAIPYPVLASSKPVENFSLL